jgi:hypothetical protein
MTSPGRCRSDDIPLNRTGAAHVVPDRDQTHPGPAGNGAPDARYHEGASDKGSTSTCTGACAAAWPPVTASAMPMAGGGVSQSMLGTTKRADGTEQLTYNGHPLYYFAADTGAGMAKGQGVKAFGSDWYVVNAKGSKIDDD